MKRIAAMLSVVLLMGAGCPLFPTTPSDDSRVEDGSENEANASERTSSGTVVSVNLDAIAADGPAVVTIRTEAGAEEQIQVPSFGLMLCAASESIADVYALQSGDRVEVRGSVSEDGAIVPCESSEHYLRVVTE